MFEFVGGHLRNGGGEVAFLDYGITDDHDFIKQQAVFLHRYVVPVAFIWLEFIVKETEGRSHKCLSRSFIKCPSAIYICRGTFLGPLDQQPCPDYRISLFVDYPSSDCLLWFILNDRSL